MTVMERDWNARVFPEYSELNVAPERDRETAGPRFGIRLRPLHEVARLVGDEPYPLIVCKPLVESHRARELVGAIAGARCVWMFRHYRDVAESFPRTWPDEIHVRNLGPIVNRAAGDWRAELVPEDVRELIARHYAPDMNPLDGAALFWYARNRLLFDLELVSEPWLMLLRYEQFVAEPTKSLRRIYEFSELEFPGAGMARGIHKRAVGRGRDVQLSDEVEACCDAMWVRMLSAERSRPGDTSQGSAD